MKGEVTMFKLLRIIVLLAAIKVVFVIANGVYQEDCTNIFNDQRCVQVEENISK